jgi:hypothetical protein
MPLNLYQRHFCKPGKCPGGHTPDSRTYEAEERLRRTAKCGYPIDAARSAGKSRRKNTQQTYSTYALRRIFVFASVPLYNLRK